MCMGNMKLKKKCFLLLLIDKKKHIKYSFICGYLKVILSGSDKIDIILVLKKKKEVIKLH